MKHTSSNPEEGLGGGRKSPQLIRDLTTGSVPGTMLRFAMPLFLSGLLQMVYNMVDMIVVGQMVGTSGLSAVSIGGEMMMLITFIAMGFSNAGQILLSRYVGEKRHDKIGDMVATLFTLLLSLAVIIMVLFLLTYQDIMAWLNTPESIWDYTREYVITCILGTVFIYGYNLVSAILRGMGDSKHPFMFIAIASVLNLLLDLLFVAVVSVHLSDLLTVHSSLPDTGKGFCAFSALCTSFFMRFSNTGRSSITMRPHFSQRILMSAPT